MNWKRLRTLILLGPMWLGACGGSSTAGKLPTPTEVRYLPSPPRPCLQLPPPKHPQLLPCTPAAKCSNDEQLENTSRLLDYLEVLDRWVTLAWASCKDVTP